MKCTHKNCTTCPYEYCISENVPSKNKILIQAAEEAWRSEYNKAYYKIRQEELQARARERGKKRCWARKMEKLNKCFWCGKKFEQPHEMIKYHKYYFCSTECLGEYLVDKANAKNELDTIWVDTEENMKILAQEEKGEW